MSVIVSLTTIAGRLDVCRRTCESLGRQSRPPDRIVLHVSRAPYLLDTGIDDPARLDWAKSIPGMEVSWVENTGPYRKLLPSVARASAEDIIVTADDDVFYGEDWLQALLHAAEAYPDAIACGRARRPGRTVLGRDLGYWAWPFVRPGTLATGLVPVGIAGVAYRPRLLDLEWLRDGNWRELAATTDDLWFAEALLRLGTPVLVARGVESHVEPMSHPTTLFAMNGGNEWHDFPARMRRRVMSRLGIPCCANDVNYRRVKDHSSATPRATGAGTRR